jgi:hypothetical protein
LELNEETIDVETMNPISSEINKATNWLIYDLLPFYYDPLHS